MVDNSPLRAHCEFLPWEEKLSHSGTSFHRDRAKVVRLHTEARDGCLPSEVRLTCVPCKYVFFKL